MKYTLIIEPQARHDLEIHIKSGNKSLLKKIYRLFEELEQHPKTGIGKPEQLRYEQAGVWSRRIDEKHRMLYTVEDEMVIVFVISLWGHYSDK